MYIRLPSCSSRRASCSIINFLSPSLRVLSLAIVWWNRCPHHLDQPPALTLIGLCFLSVFIAPLSPLLLERQGPTLAALSPATTGKMGMIRGRPAGGQYVLSSRSSRCKPGDRNLGAAAMVAHKRVAGA
ncbi:hypothetical protein V8E52_006613 [Russula decolorans]